MTNLLKRYEFGDFAVWDEIVAAAETEGGVDNAREEEVNAVACALMKRVRANTDLLRATMKRAGCNLQDEASPASDADMSYLTDRFGPLPVALDCFYKVVGSISLAPPDYFYGSNRLEDSSQLDLIGLDPLMIEPIADLKWELDYYDAETLPEEEADNPFNLGLCPDFLHKADISGGTPYTIYIPVGSPADRIDPIIHFDDMPKMRFVAYLRHCFEWGGFSGLSYMQLSDKELAVDLNRKAPFDNVQGDWRASSKKLLAELKHGLISF